MCLLINLKFHTTKTGGMSDLRNNPKFDFKYIRANIPKEISMKETGSKRHPRTA